MKILLVYPRTTPSRKRNPFREPAWLPLGLSFVAGSLRQKGHVVEIFDRYVMQDSKGLSKNAINEATIEKVKNFRPDVIGFNTVSPLIHDTVECAAMIRPFTGALLIAGGHHATALPALTLQKIPELDLALAGEGEESLLKLAEGVRPRDVPGVAYRQADGTISCNGPQQIENLDKLPFPVLDLLDMGFYLRPGTQAIRGHYLSTISLITARGCLRRCDFCSESLTYGRGIRYHSPEYVLAWIEKLLAEYRFEGLYFHDNNFLSDEQRAARIMEMLIRKGISRQVKWAAQTRADTLRSDILALMKRSGCVLVEIGIEASAQKDLDQYHKGTTVEINERAIALCRKAGLAMHAYMLTALRGETVSDLNQRRKWLERARPTSFSWHPLKVYPGTRLYLECGDGFFEKSPWTEKEIMAFFNEDRFSEISPSERKKWMKSRYEPFSRWWMRRTILKMNSVEKIARLAARSTKRRIAEKLPFLFRVARNPLEDP